ncbi:hypothetical protein [Dermabacter hominis]
MNIASGGSDFGGAAPSQLLVDVCLPLIEILAAIAVPLMTLYVQRHFDQKRMTAELERIERDRVRDARKHATNRCVAALAPFVNLDPFQVDIAPLVREVRVSLIQLIDEYPTGHPINDLVVNQYQLGIGIQRAIMESGPPVVRASTSAEESSRLKLELLSPLGGWAAHFTNDLRVIQAENVSDDEIRSRLRQVRDELSALYERNGWEPPPQSSDLVRKE